MDPAALGRYLRESREAKELTLDDAVRSLRIRRPMLEAFERGEFELSDSPVQIRGLLRNYSRYLGLDEERVLQYYESALDSNRRKRRRNTRRSTQEVALTAQRKVTDTPPAMPKVVVEPDRAGGILAFLRGLAMLTVSVASIAVIAFVIYDTVIRDGDGSSIASAILATDDPMAGNFTQTPTYTPSWTPQPSQPAPTSDAALGISGVRVELTMLQRSWVRISVDDVEQFTGILEPQARRILEGSNNVQVDAANAAALVINYNGTALPILGERGQQIQVDMTTSGWDRQFVNSASPTPAPSNTPIPSSTPIVLVSTNTPDIAPSPSPTQESSDLPTANPAFGAQTSADSNVAPSPTPLFRDASAAQSSPQSEPSQANTPPTATATPTIVLDGSVVDRSSGFATNTAVPTSDATQTSVPVADDVVLPLRATPSNPTPVKR